jgi:hypothetical protein
MACWEDLRYGTLIVKQADGVILGSVTVLLYERSLPLLGALLLPWGVKVTASAAEFGQGR